MATDRSEDEFLALVALAKNIVETDSLMWEEKYEAVFSSRISKRIQVLGFSPDYYDPDTTYEEDVTAYVNAIGAKADELLEERRKSFW